MLCVQLVGKITENKLVKMYGVSYSKFVCLMFFISMD
jgi:hypothetical protein